MFIVFEYHKKKILNNLNSISISRINLRIKYISYGIQHSQGTLQNI
jgi:hypothetical protein